MSAERIARALEEGERLRAEARRLTAMARDELRAAVWEVVEGGWQQVEVARYLSEATGEEWSRQRVWALMHERDDEYEEVGS
jgi:hypothetical protein